MLNGERRFPAILPPSYYFLDLPHARLPSIGARLPRSGGPVSRAIGRWTLAMMDWRVDGDIPDLPKLVIIAAPHTSNWDFVVGIAAKFALGLGVIWLGKDVLFRAPLGPLMRALGGRPVDRSASHDVVADIVREFGRSDRLVLALAPEGTRRRVTRWRTGFYHIAHGAGVPIVPVALNWDARAIQIGRPFTTTGDISSDLPELQDRFSAIRGRNEKR
jgi:1-acyl-sn-glycerol-3-phosphate acyltransferase